MLLPGGSFCLRAKALGGGSPGAFPFGRGFWPRDGDLLVDLVVDLVRRRNIKPTLGEMRGYYKEAACDVYAQLNPYKSYGKDWDEIGRQSYTLGDIGA